jgi:hypothetical protein
MEEDRQWEKSYNARRVVQSCNTKEATQKEQYEKSGTKRTMQNKEHENCSAKGATPGTTMWEE